MKKLITIFCLLLSYSAFAQPIAYKRAPLREIQLSGSGYSLGLQHGTLLKREIGELVVKMKENASRALGKDANEVIKSFMQYAHFNEAIKKYTSDLFEEVRGIAEGSAQNPDDIMTLNLLDEFWVYLDDLANHHCSAVGVPASDGQPAYIAQNVDIEAYTDGYQILIRLSRTATSPEQLILTHPGLIALAGMNEAGIGACMNSLMQLKASSKGLPVAFIVRRLLNSTNKEDILNFIQTVPHASGQNYIIGIKDEVYDFEASANKVVRFDPKNNNGSVYHTNHPLVNNDVKEWFSRYNPDLENKPGGNSAIRLTAVKNRIAETNIIADTLIKQTLRSKDDRNNPVCRSAQGGGFSFASLIMTLSGKPFLQITAGPPDESEYQRIDFSRH